MQAQSQSIKKPQLEQRHSFEPLALRSENQTSQGVNRAGSAPDDCEKAAVTRNHTNSIASPNSTELSLSSEKPSALSLAPLMGEAGSIGQENDNEQIDFKEEDLDDDDDDDDDMLDVEDGSNPQTAAERRAERRKMKRFRYVFKGYPSGQHINSI